MRWAALFAVVSVSWSAAGQELIEGSLDASSFSPIGRHESLSIAFGHDAELNHRLAGVATRRLIERGMAVRPRSPLELMIETEIEDASERTRNFRMVGEGGNRGGSGTSVGVQGRVTGNKREAAVPRGRYRVTMTVTRAGQTKVWWGTVAGVYSKPDREAALSDLIERLVSVIGQTADKARLDD